MDDVQHTEAVFTATAGDYDRERSRLIPGYEEFYATAVALLPQDAGRVLDLGAGTGLMTTFVRERFHDATLQLIDNSQAMLQQARNRFAADPQVTFQVGDYKCCDWGTPCDAIVSALSIHHLTDGNKRALFTRIQSVLKPGGVFVNAEQILQPTPKLEAAARQQWLEDVRALGATEQQIADSLLRQTQDRCAMIDDQLRWLREAGFAIARCTWQSGRFAVMVAYTPSQVADRASR